MPKLKNAKEDLSYKSKKADIWNAYNEILNTFENTKDMTSLNITTNNLAKTSSSLKTQLLSEIEGLLEQFENANKVLERLAVAEQDLKESIAREEDEAKFKRQRAEEEWNYEFEKRKKRQNEEITEIRSKVDAELGERRQALKESEEELKTLREKVAGFEKIIEKQTTETAKKITDEITLKFNHEIELLKAKSSSTEQLLQQKVSTLENTIKSQNVEIERLQKTLSENSEHLSKIAQRAVTRVSDTPEKSTEI